MDNQTTSATQDGIFQELLDTSPYEKSLKNARTWLYVIAGFQGAIGIFEYFTTEPPTLALFAMIIDFVIGGVFLGLSLWSKKKPYMAFILALSFYALVLLALFLLDPSTIIKGIIFKVLIIAALIKAIKDAKKYEEVKAAMQ